MENQFIKVTMLRAGKIDLKPYGGKELTEEEEAERSFRRLVGKEEENEDLSQLMATVEYSDWKEDCGYVLTDSITLIESGEYGTTLTQDTGREVLVKESVDEVYKMICGYVTYKRD